MRKLLIIPFLFATTFGFCQKQELGKVTIEELSEKICPIDSSAVAAYLFNTGKTFFGYSGDEGYYMITEIYAKIKVYKKEGYDVANQSILYYNGGTGKVKVDISKAVTYNLVDGKVEKTKLGGGGEFDEKVNEYYGRKKITMPNVKEGSIIEFKIEINSPFIANFPEWDFQRHIPVNYSEYTTYIPEKFTYNIHLKGSLVPQTLKDSRTRKVDYSYHLTASPGAGGHGAETHKSELTLNENITTYKLTGIAALRKESFVNNMDNYSTSILHELAGIRQDNGNFKSYADDWESVVKGIYEHEDFGSELNKTGYFEKDIDGILAGITSSEEKIGAIFNFVKSRMNWNEYYGYRCNAGVKKAYQDKKGNVAEINLMLTSMLRYAGFNANPILVSSRSNGISLYPSKSAYNYVISGVEMPNHLILLDATDKHALPDILPVRALNWFGRIIRTDKSSAQIDLMPKSNSKQVINVMANIKENGEISGKVRDQYLDYNAFVFREDNNGVSKDSYIEKLEKEHHGLEVVQYEVQNSTDLAKPLIENYEFTSTNSVEQIGDKLYVSPMLFFARKENPFKQETREYPIDFVFPKQTKYNISLIIPEGYAVELLPATKLVSMPDNLASFKYNITNTGNQIHLLYTFDINQAIIGADYYQELKVFYKEIIDKQTEKIVLKKV